MNVVQPHTPGLVGERLPDLEAIADGFTATLKTMDRTLREMKDLQSDLALHMAYTRAGLFSIRPGDEVLVADTGAWFAVTAIDHALCRLTARDERGTIAVPFIAIRDWRTRGEEQGS